MNHASRPLRGHPLALFFRLLPPVVDLLLDRQQEHFDAAENFLIARQPFAVMVGTNSMLADDRADQASLKRCRLPGITSTNRHRSAWQCAYRRGSSETANARKDEMLTPWPRA